MKTNFLAANKNNLINALTAFMFTTTGPIAVMLSVGAQGGLSGTDISSWLFAAYALGGLISIIFSYTYKMPITFLWTIPGAMLLTVALSRFHFTEIIGAYIASGLLITVLGMSGWMEKLMKKLPFPIVMGMIGGLFLPYGLNIIYAFQEAFWIAVAVLFAYILFSVNGKIAAVIPPVFAALAGGFAAALAMGQFKIQQVPESMFIQPQVYLPQFSWAAMIELVIPLTITVIAIQNAQGLVVLKMNGYEPPVNASTLASGVGSIFFGLLGSVPACLTGPVNAILNHSGPKDKRYIGGMLFGVMSIIFGVFSPVVVAFTSAFPNAFIGMLGGLAMIQVLRSSLVEAFSSKLSLGALVTFMVTVSNVSIFHIGSAFWGLVFGLGTSRLLERNALREASSQD